MSHYETYHEASLIEGLTKSSVAAFDALYLRYFDPLLAHTSEITKSRTMAEDIVQDVFMRLWDRREAFSGYDKVSGWLFVATYNSALNFLRQQSREKSRLARLGHLSIQGDEKDFIMQEAQFRLMEEAVERLPPQRKRVFLLCKYEGLTYEQTACQLSISKNTVKEHLSKASEFIRDYVRRTSAENPIALSTLVFLHYFMSN